MTNKKERIYIKIFKKDVCKDCCDDKYCKEHNIKCNCKIDYNEALTRKDAIEVMAKAIHLFEWGHNKNMPQWTELNNDI